MAALGGDGAPQGVNPSFLVVVVNELPSPMLLVLMRCISVVILMTKSSYFGRALICPSGRREGFDLAPRHRARLALHRSSLAAGATAEPHVARE